MSYNHKLRPLVVHIIPYDDVGGVEMIARSIPALKMADLVFRKFYQVESDSVDAAIRKNDCVC